RERRAHGRAGGDVGAAPPSRPESHYRAAAVFDFHDEVGLTPELLREVSQHQIGVLARSFEALDADPAVIRRDRTVPLDQIGGFLALEAPAAGALAADLHRQGVFTDSRGAVLRLGPAPYLSDSQLTDAVTILGHTAQRPTRGLKIKD